MTDEQLAAQIDDARKGLNELLREAWMRDLMVAVQIKSYGRGGPKHIGAVTYSKVLPEDATCVSSRIARAVG